MCARQTPVMSIPWPPEWQSIRSIGPFLERFHSADRILMVGTFASPLTDGSMGVFPTREDAEDFVAGDPFMVRGLVASWRIMEWNESLTPD